VDHAWIGGGGAEELDEQVGADAGHRAVEAGEQQL
jgi:hypothetical protein